MDTSTSKRSRNPKLEPNPATNTEKDPDDWVSGDDPMTGAQASYLKTLNRPVNLMPIRTI